MIKKKMLGKQANRTLRCPPPLNIARSRPVTSRPSCSGCGGGGTGGGFVLPAVDLSVEWLWEIREKLLTHEYLVLLATVRCRSMYSIGVGNWAGHQLASPYDLLVKLVTVVGYRHLPISFSSLNPADPQL